MDSSLEQAYSAVEHAYGEGDFVKALQRAEALAAQVPSGRPDWMDLRLQLLLGHIHLYGLSQPEQAQTAYQRVLDQCQEPTYRHLAEQGLNLSEQQLAAIQAAAATATRTSSSPEPAAAAELAEPQGAVLQGADPAIRSLPATPWLAQLPNPQQALTEIQQAWAAVPPAAAPAAPAPTPAAADEPEPASPWIPAEAPVLLPEAQEQPQDQESEPEATEPVSQLEAEPDASAPEPEAEENPDTAPESALEPDTEPSALTAEPVLAPEDFSDLEQGLLLVQLGTATGSGRSREPDPSSGTSAGGAPPANRFSRLMRRLLQR